MTQALRVGTASYGSCAYAAKEPLSPTPSLAQAAPEAAALPAAFANAEHATVDPPPEKDWPLPAYDREIDITQDLANVEQDDQEPAGSCDMSKWIVNTPFYRRVYLGAKGKPRGRDDDDKNTHNIKISVAIQGEVRPVGFIRRGMRMKEELEDVIMKKTYGCDWPMDHTSVYLCIECEAKKLSQKVKNRWIVCVDIDCWARVFSSQIKRNRVRPTLAAQKTLKAIEAAAAWRERETTQQPPAKRARVMQTQRYVAVAFIYKPHDSTNFKLVTNPYQLCGLLYRPPEVDRYIKAQDDWMKIFQESPSIGVCSCPHLRFVRPPTHHSGITLFLCARNKTQTARDVFGPVQDLRAVVQRGAASARRVETRGGAARRRHARHVVQAVRVLRPRRTPQGAQCRRPARAQVGRFRARKRRESEPRVRVGRVRARKRRESMPRACWHQAHCCR